MLSKIMKQAWVLFRKYRDFYTFAECLKFAWRVVRDGMHHVICISTNVRRKFEFAFDFETADKVRKVRTIELKRDGHNVWGSNISRIG